MWMIVVIKINRNCVIKTAKVLTRPKWVKWLHGVTWFRLFKSQWNALGRLHIFLKLYVYNGVITMSASWFFMQWIHSKIYAGGSRLLPGIILGMGSANERRRYYVTPPLIGRAHTQNDPKLAFVIVRYVMILPISFRVISLSIGPSYDWPSIHKVILNNMGKWIIYTKWNSCEVTGIKCIRL